MSNFTNNPLPLVKEEQQHSSPLSSTPPQQQQHLPMDVKAEPKELAISQLQQEQEQEEPQFLKSIDQLGTLSTVIDTFKRRFDELQKHLEFIRNAMDSKFNDKTSSSPPQFDAQLAAIVPFDATETPRQTDATETETVRKSETERKPKPELQHLCETMCSRSLRKYIITHLSEIQRLREEAPAALKLSSRPAKLVLDCIGRFFLQGVKAYTKDSPMIPARQASVLVLEFFLRMLGDPVDGREVVIDNPVKEEAEMGAIAWRKRLISEGGLSRTNKTDARGLLLFVACFGIPSAFRGDELRDLIRLSDHKEISDVLRRSRVLVPRISDIIEGMVKKGMHVEAVDVAYTFGMEDKFSPQTILTSFLRESKDALKRMKQEAHNSPMALKHANEKHLARLKSVVKCLEDHKIDPTKVLSGWQIKEQMAKLEKDIADLNKRTEDKATSKRKTEEIESADRFKNQETKRSRFAAKGSSFISPHINGLHDQRIASHADGTRSYDGLMPSSVGGGFPGHVNNYLTPPSLSHGSGVGSLPENILGPNIGGGEGSMHAARVGGSMAAGISYLPTGSYSGVHGETGIDKLQKTMSNNGLPYGWHGVGEAAYIDRSIRQSFAGQQTSMGVGGLYGPSTSVEGYVGLPNFPSNAAAAVASWNSASDLYGFADAVVESEPYNSSSHKAGPPPSSVPAHYSSYMY